MKIPKSFKLFATTVKVIFDDKSMSDQGYLGEASYVESTITLTKTYRSDVVSDDKLMDTFYHEKVHMILESMSKNELSRDEEFVDVFAKLLRQSDETAKY